MDAEAPTVPEPSPARQQIQELRREMEDMDVDEGFKDDDGVMLEEVEDDGGLAESDEEDLPPTQDDASLKFDKHEDAVYCVAVSKSGAILSGGGDDRAWLQPAPMGSRGAICLEGHNDSVTACGFSHQDSMCATGAYDGSVKLWDTASGRLLRTLEGPGDVEWLAWHPKGDVVLCGACDGTLWMWLATSGACMRVFAGHDGAVLCGGFTCDGKKIVSGSADGSLRVWNPRKGQCAISASRCVETPSRHRRDSCPSHHEVGGFFFDFEAIRTDFDRNAPRRCPRVPTAQGRIYGRNCHDPGRGVVHRLPSFRSRFGAWGRGGRVCGSSTLLVEENNM